MVISDSKTPNYECANCDWTGNKLDEAVAHQELSRVKGKKGQHEMWVKRK